MPRSVNAMVEQQIQRWLAEQERRAARGAAPQRPPPVVTVSREAGARGTELAGIVARRLDFHLWDQELVQRMAEQSGASEALLRHVDEQARNAIEDLLAGILMGDSFTEKEYMTQLLRVIHAVAQHGSAVIVGRGAHFVLDPGAALRVRVVAPLDVRARNIAAARGLSEHDSQLEVDRIDRERLTFMRHHFGRDATDADGYDLVVNSGTLSLERAADVVVSAYRAKFPSG